MRMAIMRQTRNVKPYSKSKQNKYATGNEQHVYTQLIMLGMSWKLVAGFFEDQFWGGVAGSQKLLVLIGVGSRDLGANVGEQV